MLSKYKSKLTAIRNLGPETAPKVADAIAELEDLYKELKRTHWPSQEEECEQLTLLINCCLMLASHYKAQNLFANTQDAYQRVMLHQKRLLSVHSDPAARLIPLCQLADYTLEFGLFAFDYTQWESIITESTFVIDKILAALKTSREESTIIHQLRFRLQTLVIHRIATHLMQRDSEKIEEGMSMLRQILSSTHYPCNNALRIMAFHYFSKCMLRVSAVYTDNLVEKNQLTEACHFIEQCLQMFGNIVNPHTRQHHLFLASMYSHYGMALRLQDNSRAAAKNYECAAHYSSLALQAEKSIEAQLDYARDLLSAGICLLLCGEFIKSKTVLQEAESFLAKIDENTMDNTDLKEAADLRAAVQVVLIQARDPAINKEDWFKAVITENIPILQEHISKAGGYCNKLGNTAWHAAVIGNKPRTLEFLANNSQLKNVNQANNAGQTPLIFAVAKRDGVLVKHLLSSPHIIVDCPNAAGRTALHEAAGKGHLQLVMQLVAHGADPSYKTISEGYNALFFAVLYSQDSCLRYLLVNSPRLINECDQSGDTLLIKAFKNKNHSAVEILLYHNANTTLTNRNGESYDSLKESAPSEPKHEAKPELGKIIERVRSPLPHSPPLEFDFQNRSRTRSS